MNNSNAFLPFALPDIGEEETQAVVAALKSGWITTGPKVVEFERKFAEFVGGGVQAVAINSATAGLHLALEAIGVGPGDEVITTTHTFTATAEVIRYLGASPVFVDISPETLCLDINLLENAITPRTKAIIPVHFGGLAMDIPRLLEIARIRGIFVIEDAAHSLPSSFGGVMVGAFHSDATVFSFYANKTMTTGEGGMLVTRNDALAKRARIMRLHGISRDAFDRYTANRPSWHYEIVAPGYKYNMTDLAAAIGIEQLCKVNRFQSRRAKIAHAYDEGFSGTNIVLPPRAQDGSLHSWHLYVVRLDRCNVDRNNFIKALYSMGIGCSVHYIPLHLQPYWKKTFNLTEDMFPISQQTYEHCVSLPIYTTMTDTDVQRVIDAVKSLIS